ncbi:hypothetical protein D3C78_1109470 [compost metagenome]
MQHARAQPGQPPQAARVVEIAQQRRDALRAQGVATLCRRGQRQQAHAALGLGHAQSHIATADDQQALTAEPCRSRPERVLV